MVQKIEEVLSGALGTELQSNPDVDKNTVKNSTQSTKRSSTGEDEIPRKKAKKNKKHKSKKKKKKKKKRKKEKKHKKQPKEAKLGARPGEAADVPPAPHLLLEKSGSQVNVQQGGVGEPSLAGHLQPQLCPTASEGLDNQALGLVSHSVTDSQQSAENLGSGEGTLCATNPPFNLESNQSNIPENTGIAHSTICTSEEQIQQSHGNIYPVAINASVVDTGNDAWSSIPSGIASKSEFQKDSVEALRGSEVTLKSPGSEEVKALDAALEPEAMEVLPYSEASLQSVSQRGAQDLGTASESVSLASGGTAIPTSTNWADPSAVTVAHVAVAGQVQKIPEATEKCVHMGNVQSVQRSLELGGVSRTLEPAQQPSVIAGNLSMTLPMGSSSVLRANVPLQHPFKLSAASPLAPVDIQSAKTPPGAGATTKMKDIEPAMESVKASETTLEPVGVTAPESLQSKSVEGPTAPAAVLGAAGAFLQRGVFPEARGVDRAVGPVLPAAPTGASAAAEPEGGRATAEPTALGQALVQQTAPQLHVAEGLRSPQARGSEGTSLPRPEGESNVRGLAPAPSLQKEDVQGLGGVLRPVAFTAASLALQGEGVKASEQAVHCGAVASPGLALGRTPEPVVACESVEPVREALSGVMPWQTTAEREPLSANQTQSSITSQTQVMAHTRTSQVEVHGERRDSELAPEDPSKAEARSREAVLEPVQALETSSKPVQEQIVGLSTAVLESLPSVEENNVTELTDVQTQGPAVEYLLGTRTSMQRNEPSEMEKAKYLGPAPEAGEVGWLESMKESATVEVKDSGTGGELEVAVDDASAAVPESLHTEKPEELQGVLEVKPAAEWKSSEEAPEILGAAGLKSSEAVPKPGDVKGLETTQEHTVTAEVQYAEGVQGQQVEDMLIEKEDAEQTQPSEPIAETVLSSSHAAEEKDSTVTPEAGTQDSEAAPQADVELKDAAAVGLEAETKDLEAAPVPETEAEAAQAEVIPETEDVKEATPEEDSEKRDSETSDVQPDVAARMKETLMRLENVVEKSSHRSSEKKHDSKKQKRSRSKSQSRSRKRKKKSRSRSTSRRLTSKRARSRSRNYSVSRKKHSKSRSRSVEKRERRVSSRRSRRRRSSRSGSSDRSKSRSRSVEKRGRKASVRRSKRQRSKSSDRYKSRSRSVEKRDRKQSSRKSKRQRSKSSDRYKSRSKSVEKKKESSRKSKRRRSKSSERYKSRSRSVEKKRKESSKKSKRKRSKSSDSVKSRSKSVEKRENKLSAKSSKHAESSELQESTKSLENVPESSVGSEGKSSNGPMSMSLSEQGINGPELPPSYGSGFSKTSDNLEESSSSVEKTDLQSSAMSEMDTSKTPDNQELRSMSVEKTQDSELSMTSENGSAEKAEALESSPLPELPYSTPKSRSSSVEKRRDAETSSAAEFHLSTSHGDVSRTTPLREVEGPELPPSLLSDYKTISSSSGSVEAQGSSVPPEGTLSNSSDGPDSRHIPGEQTELPQFLQGPEHGSSQLAASPGAVEAQRPSLAPEGTHPAIPDGQEPSLASDSGYFMSPDGRGSGSCFATPVDQPSLSVGESFKSPDGNEQRYLSVEKVKAADVSLTSVCGSVEISDDLVSVSSFKVHESRSSVDKGLDGPTLPQVLEVDCSRSSEMHESRYLPAGKIDGAGSLVLSKSGISVCHDGHKAKYNSFESTEGAELSVASELRCSVFPEGYKLASAAVDKVEIHKSPLSLEGGFSVSADGESVSTPEKLQPPATALPSEEGVVLLPDNHELRPVPAEKVEVLNSSEPKVLASPDSYRLGSAHDEIQVQESRCSVASDGHEVTSTPFGRAEVEEPSGVSDNEHMIGLDGPELTSTPAEKTELRKLYQMAEERSLVSAESQELQAPSAEKAQMEEPALGSDSECTVSWLHQELRSSSPERAEVQEAAVVPDSDYAVAAEHHTLPSSLAAKPEGQECSVLPGVSPQGQEVMASPAEKEVQEPSLPPGSEYSIFPRGQGLQPGLAGNTAVQEPSPIPDSCYTASPGGLELLHAYNETPEVQECSLLSENEYDVSPERRDLRSSPAEKEEGEESESESSISTDSRELQPAAVGKTEVQELSLSEGECPMSPEGQELQSSPAERIEAKEPSVTSENEHALSPEEYEPRVTHTERAEGGDSALASERDHLFFESQEVRFPPLQKAAGQELSPAPDNEHGASPDEQELRFTSVGKADDLEPLALNDRASMSPDDRDLKSIPVEKVDHAMPSLLPEGERSVSPDGYSVRSGPGEETGDLEPSLRSERRYSTSSYQEGHELKSPMEEEGLESSLTSEHRRSVSPEGHDRKSAIDEEMDDVERRSTSPEEQESSAGEEAEDLEQPLTTERRCSVSSDEHESRSTTGEEAEDAEPSLTAERRDSISSDEHESRSTAGEDGEDGEASVTAERRHSTSSDDRESTAGEETEDLTAEHRRSVSPDGRESRSSVGEEAEDQELSLTAERRHSTSSDDHESRSTAGEDAEDVEPSSAAERRDSTSSDEQESRSDAGEEAEDVEPSLTAEHRRSASPDGAESRSTTGEEEGDDAEPSLTAEQRDSTSSEEHESESSSGEEEGEDAEPSLADEDKQDSMPLEQSEEQDSSFVPESRRSESSEREKSRSKSVDKASDKESPQRSVSRRSQSPALQKSRSTSVEKAADKETTRRYRRRRSRSTAHQRSQSTSVEKTADKESTRRSRRRRSRSTARQRSQSKSVEKAADKESSRRSRSRRSRSSQRRSKRYDTDSRSRRNRSRSATRRRASRSKSNRRSRSSSLSRSRHRRRSRSRSASRRRRSLSRDRRKRSQRNRSRSTERRRRRSDSRDRRISLRLRSRSRTPLRQRRSRSRGRRRSSSRSPIRLRRSRSSGRRRYSRSPDRRRSRSSEFSSRSPKRLTDLDKAQLLEIAKANAAAMCAKSGVPLPPSLMPLLSQKKDDKANQKSSRDTLKELTEKCKKIAQSTDDVIVNKPHVSDEEEEERPFYNHPFKLSEPKPIFFNLSTPSIKPAPPPQPKNQVSLSKEFPVSSGSQHRKKEADSVYGEWVPVDKGGKDDGKDDVFPKPAIECVDITTAMNDRAVAQKRLNENSFDLEAMCMLNRAQEQIDAWAQSNSIPGQFTGSTGAQILSSDELTNSGPQAWIRKDQFLRAAPVTGGMGAQLMRKMGWREGEGLGKNKEGSVEPIMVDFKTDRKGLVAVGEKAQKRSGHYVVMKDLSGKHPVSALMEICNKRRWTPPEFVLVDDSGPDHRKHFIFKVRVNGNEYRPTFASLNKKHAKATAATAALQAMGLVPKESMVNTTMFRSASHR
ncbi:protein SON [Manacus vitellinus]|uniref:protein SON n=1 Tax=Manacus vitellinus TaxID=328815 RepID=UPI00115F253A|nr:protein SON [Manacus vitellinus]